MKTQSSYLKRINTFFLMFLALHVPVGIGVALYFGTNMALAAALGVLFMAGPALLFLSDQGSKLTSVALGIASMCFSALLIHLSGGMIEMHFHIFTMLALLIAFRFMIPLLAAAATIAVHHVAFFLWLPHSVFPYDATFGIVAFHAFFVVFETGPALWLTHMLDKSASADEASKIKLNAMAESLRGVIGAISDGVGILAFTSTSLSDSSEQITSGSRQALNKAQLVTGVAENMNTEAVTVAGGMSETTMRLAEVAAATEEMTATIGEIATNSEKARQITGDATRRSVQITTQMDQFSCSVQAIGKITETIMEISAQTNLLALNATIEAARAGSAGKGFSVVASEIKVLAQQTSKATDDIKSLISGLRSSTDGGIAEIKKVSEVIGEISSIVAVIAAAIEEQSAVTRGIAQNLSSASCNVKDANEKISRTSVFSNEITKDIYSVVEVSSGLALSSEQLLVNSSEISQVAEQLRLGMSSFQGFYDTFFSDNQHSTAPARA
jgi:methyl-accepting chemotaxis protein